MLVTVLLFGLGVAGALPRQQCRLLDNIPFFNTPARSAQVDREVALLTEFARFAQAEVPGMLARFTKYKRLLNSEANPLLRSIQPRLARAMLFEENEVLEYRATTTEAMMTDTTEPVTDTTVVDETTTVIDETTVAGTTEAEATTVQDATTEPAQEEEEEEEEDDRDDIEKSIEEAVDAIVNAVKETFEQFKETPLSISNVQSIGSGVINGLKNILAQIGVAVPEELPEFEEIDFPDLPAVPSLGEFSLADWPLLCKVVWWPHEDEHCKSMRCAACSTAMIAAGKVCERTQGRVDHRCLRDVLLDGACGFCTVDFLE